MTAAQPRERGILFQAPLVRAIIAGTKTQTRRLATPNQPIPADLRSFEMRKDPVFGSWVLGPAGSAMVPFFQAAHGWVNAAFGTPKYGVPGDRLWVRETWGFDSGVRADFKPIGERDLSGMNLREYLVFRADESPRAVPYWRPAIHLPRWASRITLEITEVRVERLQAITEEDAKAEGIVPQEWVDANAPFRSHRGAFQLKWDEINGKKASWSSNPFVWAIAFRRSP